MDTDLPELVVDGAAAQWPRRDARTTRLRALLEAMIKARGDVPVADYSALSVLLEDAKLEADEPTLIEGQRGLQRVHARQLLIEAPTPQQSEQRGRILQMLEGLSWTLRRMTPAAVIKRIERGSLADRFLAVVAANPGVYSGEIAERLDHAREDVLSRVGNRLEDAGLVRKQRAGRHKHWYITPRGRRVLDEISANGG
jgi:DNA-binding transcriptional ArsR family regulator